MQIEIKLGVHRGALRGRLHGIEWTLFVCKLGILLFVAGSHGVDHRRGLNPQIWSEHNMTCGQKCASSFLTPIT